MYNTELPTRAELPSSQQLIKSTLIAAVTAGVLLVTVVLPSEYGVDPTGIGRVLGLTGMGEIKNKLALEAAADAAATKAAAANATTIVQARLQDTEPAAANPATGNPAAAPTAGKPVANTASPSQGQCKDALSITLKPGKGSEVKLAMTEGAKAQYTWTVESGQVNYDTHGDGGGQSICYQKGRGVSSDEGMLTAAFTGNHGWFWRNRGTSDVKLMLRTRGDYASIKKVM